MCVREAASNLPNMSSLRVVHELQEQFHLLQRQLRGKEAVLTQLEKVEKQRIVDLLECKKALYRFERSCVEESVRERKKYEAEKKLERIEEKVNSLSVENQKKKDEIESENIQQETLKEKEREIEREMREREREYEELCGYKEEVVKQR